MVATPNTVLATPFRSVRSDGSATPGSVGFMTPKSGAMVPVGGAAVAAAYVTPSIRDKLNINLEEVSF